MEHKVELKDLVSPGEWQVNKTVLLSEKAKLFCPECRTAHNVVMEVTLKIVTAK